MIGWGWTVMVWVSIIGYSCLAIWLAVGLWKVLRKDQDDD